MQPDHLVLAGVLVLVLTPIVATDLREQRIPNAWNLVLGLAGLAGQLWLEPHWRTVIQALFAALATGVMFAVLLLVMKALKRQGGLGMGDVKFMIAASQWVGFLGGAWTFCAAGLLAVVWATVIAPWRGLDLKRPFAFAPALSAALLAVFALSAPGG